MKHKLGDVIYALCIIVTLPAAILLQDHSKSPTYFLYHLPL